jgi:hypothetical protein
VDSVDGPHDRNQTLFRVNFTLDALRRLITRRRLDRITETLEEEAQLIPGDNPMKAVRLLFHQCRQKELRIDTLLLSCLTDRTASEDGNFQAKLVVKDQQTRGLSNPEVATKHVARTERPLFK